MVNLVAPINQLGYGVVGYNVLKALQEAGHNVSYFPLGQPSWTGNLDNVKAAAENAKKNFNSTAPSIRIWHQNDMAMFPGKGKRIGWPIFELDTFDEQEKLHLSSVDQLFVCSEWAKQVLIDNGIKPPLGIKVIPLGVDTSVFFKDDGAMRRRAYWTKEKTVFLNIGKWEVRKGHNELLEAFNKAFSPEDKVELWMMNANPFIGKRNEEWKSKYLASPMGESIRLLPRVNSQQELAAIFNTVDFGVFPAHAEGWNLEPLELLACGVPSVVTNYSGHTQYLDASNSFLVEPTGMEAAHEAPWFHGQGNWCSFEVDDLAEAMKAARNYKQNDESHLEAGIQATVDKFTWANTIKLIEEEL